MHVLLLEKSFLKFKTLKLLWKDFVYASFRALLDKLVSFLNFLGM